MQITGNHQMARIVRHNDESVREGYIRNGGKEVKLFTSALKAFQYNNRIVMAQRKHLDDFLRGRIIGRLECGRTQLKVSEELGIAQSVISRLWQRFQDDGNVSRCYSTGRPRVTTPNEDRYLAVTAKRNRRSTASDLSRQLSSATGTTVSRQTVYRRLGHIGLYARRPVRCVPLTATHCRLRLAWSREHALWTPQQWSCVMFSDESRFSLQSDSRRTFIWRAPGTRYHQENTIERHRYGGAGWLVWGGIILGSRTDLHVQNVTMTGHIYRDVILEQHVRLFRGAMGAEFLFMDDNACPHRANIVDECLQSEDITRMDWPAYSPDLNPIEHVWDMLGQRIATRQPPPTCLPELRRALLDEWCNIPQDQIDNFILSMLRRLGRLCEWKHKTIDKSAEVETFEEYKKTLTLDCMDGSPGTFHWVPDEGTPDLVYYQCFTHPRNLGWKIMLSELRARSPGDEHLSSTRLMRAAAALVRHVHLSPIFFWHITAYFKLISKCAPFDSFLHQCQLFCNLLC
ncbi:Transposable element Tcb2 transposase [Araneus ventricosus]|uniref:Transposable element Tcb2 transposase n=1 Tax=Araneus ventricosus TaxID=182803 RepID=A0A4Y2M3S7_ARAVE|nr:Transposable element Tcb2 transposase [Araneus ventricosus]